MIRVVHLSRWDARGGAARSAYRLHTALRDSGIASSMLVLERDSNDPDVRQYQWNRGLWPGVKRKLRRMRLNRERRRYEPYRTMKAELFTDDRMHGQDLFEQLPPCDLVHLHWVSGLVDYPSFFAAAPGRVPMVWTLHDMNPFTGGCHYDSDCGRWRRECGSCPQLGQRQEHDLSRQVMLRKISTLGGVSAEQMHLVTPSRWLAEQVRQSPVLGRFPVRVIPYSLDLNVFRPRDRDRSRRALGLGAQDRVVLFMAEVVTGPRKGFTHLVEAIRGMPQSADTVLCCVGRGKLEADLGIRQMHLGTVNDDQRLSAIYSAADVFVIPSLQDNLPNTVMEALACGTPVVGFDAGGIPDMVRNGQTGLLAAAGESRALGQAIQNLLDDSALRQKLSRECRAVAESEYAPALQAARYFELYRDLLGAKAQQPDANQFQVKQAVA